MTLLPLIGVLGIAILFGSFMYGMHRLLSALSRDPLTDYYARFDATPDPYEPWHVELDDASGWRD